MKKTEDEKQLKVDADYIDENTESINKEIQYVLRDVKKRNAELITILNNRKIPLGKP
jgi:hypothetical protein